MRVKISQISRVIWEMGCSRPRSRRRPGRVTSRPEAASGPEGRSFQAIQSLLDVRLEQLFQAVGLLPELWPNIGRQAAQRPQGLGDEAFAAQKFYPALFQDLLGTSRSNFCQGGTRRLLQFFQGHEA